jgi:hypothetical protein
MHVDNLKTGMWIRIEGIRPYKFAVAEEAYIWSQQIDTARNFLAILGGLPLQVVAYQYPFVMANAGPHGTVMVDLRFNVIGKIDEKFRSTVSKLRSQSKRLNTVDLPPGQCNRPNCRCRNDDCDDDEMIDG